MSIEDIIGCIGDDIEIGTRPIDAGLSKMKILVNIEAQKSSDSSKLGYHLENRIVFYLARMISAQKHTEFFHSDFVKTNKCLY